MAGTQTQCEAAPQYVCNQVQTTGPVDVFQSMNSIDTRNLTNSATCYVRPPFDLWYRYDQFDNGPGLFPTRIKPISNVGTWVMISGGTAGGKKCPTVYTVNTDGTGDYPTVADALNAANLNATPTKPIQVLLCPGVYSIPATLVIASQFVSLVGEQAGQVALLGNLPTGGGAVLLSVTAPSGQVQLENLILAIPPNVASPIAISLTGSATIVAHRCQIETPSDSATMLNASNGSASFTDCILNANGDGATGFNTGIGFAELTLLDCLYSVLGTGAATLGNISAATTIRLTNVRGSSTTGWVLLADNVQYFEKDSRQTIGSGGGAVIDVQVTCEVRVANSVWDGPNASFGVRTLLGGAAIAPVIALDDVAWTNQGTFVQIGGTGTTCDLRSCLSGSSTIPWDVQDDAVLIVADGQMNPDAGLATTPLNVRWQTSGNAQSLNGMDVKQGSTDAPGRALAARQVMVRIPFTPCGIDDPLGDVGNWAWDDQGPFNEARFFIKIGGPAPGWYVIPLTPMAPCGT